MKDGTVEMKVFKLFLLEVVLSSATVLIFLGIIQEKRPIAVLLWTVVLLKTLKYAYQHCSSTKELYHDNSI